MVKIMMVVMAMLMIKCSGLEKKKEKNKRLKGPSFIPYHHLVDIVSYIS